MAKNQIKEPSIQYKHSCTLEYGLEKLINYDLKSPINYTLEWDDQYYIAESTDFPIYAIGDTELEAIEALKLEIENLYSELQENEKLSDEWAKYKFMLQSIIIKHCE